MAEHPEGLRRQQPPMASYANYFEIGHNAAEFLIDIGQLDPESGDVRLSKRVALSPANAKLLTTMLNGSIEEFERQHSPIPDLSIDDELGDFGLTNPTEFERRAIDARRRVVEQHSSPAKR